MCNLLFLCAAYKLWVEMYLGSELEAPGATFSHDVLQYFNSEYGWNGCDTLRGLGIGWTYALGTQTKPPLRCHIGLARLAKRHCWNWCFTRAMSGCRAGKNQNIKTLEKIGEACTKLLGAWSIAKLEGFFLSKHWRTHHHVLHYAWNFFIRTFRRRFSPW